MEYAWNRPPSAWCLSSWSTAACQTTCVARGGSLPRRPCWACVWTYVRAWPTWKRSVSSTETWMQGKTYKSRVKGHVPLKCRTTKTGNARINKKAQAFFLPVATSSFLHPRGRSSWDSVLGSIPSPTSNFHSLSWSLHSSKMKLTAAPP